MEGTMTAKASSTMPGYRVSVVIPTLNEARNLPYVFGRLPLDAHEVIVVDGHSVDDTVAVARRLRPDARTVMQTRKGKGNALACGFAAATGDIIAMVDADGSADPGEIPRFVRALADGADFAKGTRFASGGGSSDITRLRTLGNRALGALVNLTYRTRYTDLCYGFNVFWRRHVPVLGLDATSPAPPGGGRLWGDGFEVETLIHLRAAEAGLTVTEVPSFEYSRIHGVSNLSAFSDGLRVLRTILAERHRSVLSASSLGALGDALVLRAMLAEGRRPVPAASRQGRAASAAMPVTDDDSTLDGAATWPMLIGRLPASCGESAGNLAQGDG
jgi:hypothetical protein